MKPVMVMILATGCSTVLLNGQSIDYLSEIKPLLKQRCYSCHGALKQKVELRLDTAEFIRKGSKNGLVVKTNSVNESQLLERVTSKDADERMPPEGESLSAEQIEKLRRWIGAGAPAPANEKPEPDPREHWAFRQPLRPAVPKAHSSSFLIRNPIDSFLATDWERHGLTPAPAAAKAILLRRVYLDLIGLPPTREQLRSFLADTRVDAYERVVDGLLGSSQYGERWARHWMDIWRYADWYGRRHVPDVWNSAPQIWRWREWIVNSLNADKSYERMILEMLAGDEVAPEDEQITVATGFLVRNWYALNPNQWMRDNVEHTAKAFLGLTLNCAHCHDHKYDPLTQHDYFTFRAFFEPLGLRQDRVRGETDPGPFQKYEYSVARKVATNGVVRVFDENLDAKTFVYLRGDERDFPEGKPTMEPLVPAFLRSGDERVGAVELPIGTWYPGAKPWIRELELEKRTTELESAKAALNDAEAKLAVARQELAALIDGSVNALDAQAQAFVKVLRDQLSFIAASNRIVLAQAELMSINARLAADASRFLGASGSDSNELAAAASKTQRRVALFKARSKVAEAEHALSLLKAEHAVAAVRRGAERVSADTEKKATEVEKAALTKAAEQLASSGKVAESAEVALQTNGLSYTSVGPVYPSHSSGRRTALARWIGSRQNPLSARVAVNHLWSRHFHAPLVKSVFDFGRNGSPPTHPDLLDWLAVEFMEHGWNMKHLHRLIVTSSAYRVSSSGTADSDPENLHLSRMNTGQMEAELVRDTILFVAGDLEPRLGGPVLPNTEADRSRRRSIYFEVFPEAGGHDPFSEMFDAPNPNECYRRTSSIVPQQALALTNSKLPTEESRVLAKALTQQLGNDASAFVTGAYESILSRAPSDLELSACRDFLQRQAALAHDEIDTEGPKPALLPPELRARASLMRVLFNHNDFLTIR